MKQSFKSVGPSMDDGGTIAIDLYEIQTQPFQRRANRLRSNLPSLPASLLLRAWPSIFLRVRQLVAQARSTVTLGADHANEKPNRGRERVTSLFCSLSSSN